MDHDPDEIQQIVLPLMNVSRRLPDNTVNEKEPNQQIISCTSAGSKISYAYDKLIDTFEESIISPKAAFVMGLDYRVPVMHGLLAKDFVNKLKMSPSYNEENFAQEYLSYWSGGNEDSWFNFSKLAKYRKIKNPEKAAKIRVGENCFYLISVDVGRLHDQTVVCVHKVHITSDGRYLSTLVNLYVLGLTPETKQFDRQAADLKAIIQAFNPREVVIDTNGLGRHNAQVKPL